MFHDLHTRRDILDTLTKAMDTMYLYRRGKNIGACSDVNWKMMGRNQGLITGIKFVGMPGLMCICRSAHQIDLCMKWLYLVIPLAFFETLTSLVTYLSP